MNFFSVCIVLIVSKEKNFSVNIPIIVLFVNSKMALTNGLDIEKLPGDNKVKELLLKIVKKLTHSENVTFFVESGSKTGTKRKFYIKNMSNSKP